MAQFLKNIRVPPVKAALDVAMQTVRQNLPESGTSARPSQVGPNAPQVYADGTTSGYGECNLQQRTGERVHFATQPHNDYNATVTQKVEMVAMNQTGAGYNPFTGAPPAGAVAEESFTHGYQQTSNPFANQRNSVSSNATDSSFGEGGNEMSSSEKINEWQAAWNVTNAIQGMFIVSLPFAVLRGGYWAILAMVGIAYICCYTGKILVECLYEFDAHTGQLNRVRNSYVSIAKECFGRKYGAKIVAVAQIIELLMTCILYVVVCGDLMIGTFPNGSIDTRSWMMLTGLLLLPLGFLKSLHHVSLLSFWCTMAHLLINAIIFGYCLLEIGDWGWGKVKWTFDFENFPISLGVIVFSYTSQIFLPTLEGNMTDPSKFSWMLDWSHIAAAIFKSLFGYVCFLTFQNDTQQVITNNLRSPTFKGFVNICLVAKAILSYPLPYYAACELLERALFRGKPKTPFPTIWELDGELKVWGLAWKLAVIVFTIMMAIFIPHFSILMGFIGSFTGTMLSFIWPCYFHLKLKGSTMDQSAVAFDYFIISLGVLFGVIGVYDSGSAMIKAFQIGLPF